MIKPFTFVFANRATYILVLVGAAVVESFLEGATYCNILSKHFVAKNFKDLAKKLYRYQFLDWPLET